MSTKSACCSPELSWKSPTLSSVPAGMAAGSIVMVGCTPDCGVKVHGPGGYSDTTCEKPAGAGSEVQKLPVVTSAGMPYCARSLCRAAGSRSSPGLRVSVAVPLELLTSVNAAIRIVPVLRAGAGPRTPVRPRTSAVPAAAVTDRPATAESRCRRRARSTIRPAPCHRRRVPRPVRKIGSRGVPDGQVDRPGGADWRAVRRLRRQVSARVRRSGASKASLAWRPARSLTGYGGLHLEMQSGYNAGMPTSTVGFAVADEDQERLARLVEHFGGGNRSAYLRATLPVMESLARAERLRELQARNAERAAAAGQDHESLLAEIRRAYKGETRQR